MLNNVMPNAYCWLSYRQSEIILQLFQPNRIYSIIPT